MMSNTLYDWLFRYNHYTGLWYAIHRDDLSSHFNGAPSNYNVYTDTDINRLINDVKLIENKNGDSTENI